MSICSYAVAQEVHFFLLHIHVDLKDRPGLHLKTRVLNTVQTAEQPSPATLLLLLLLLSSAQ